LPYQAARGTATASHPGPAVWQDARSGPGVPGSC